MADDPFRLLSDDDFILDGTCPRPAAATRMAPFERPVRAAAADGDAGDAVPPTADPGVVSMPVERLHPNPAQPRRRFPEDGLRALAASMERTGVLQPVLVRPHRQHPGAFEIVAGERRWRAARLAGLAELPVIVRELSERETLEYALIENLQREELTPLEKAEAYRRLVEEFDRTPEQLARNLGKSRSHVANTMRLLGLPTAVQEMLQDGELTAGHARALFNAEDPEAVAREVAAQGLSVRQTERLVQEGRSDGAGGAARARRESRTAVLERSLSTMLGLEVSLSVHAAGGTLTIHYGDLAELGDILHRLRQPAASSPSGPAVRSERNVVTLPAPVIEHRADGQPTRHDLVLGLGA